MVFRHRDQDNYVALKSVQTPAEKITSSTYQVHHSIYRRDKSYGHQIASRKTNPPAMTTALYPKYMQVEYILQMRLGK